MGSPKVVVLTGAGISAESGLKTFRDNGGLWETHPVEEVATPEAFQANPDLVYRFYNQRRAQLLDPKVLPNPAHKALAVLEKKLGDDFLLVTQNVDNLHEEAGNKRVIHMHGELQKVRCLVTGNIFITTSNVDASTPCECCGSVGNLRPHIVWFGEEPLEIERIFDALQQTEVFLSVGTSGAVYPAAMFVRVAKEFGAKTIQINLEDADNSYYFDQTLLGRAGDILPGFVDSFVL